MLRQSKNTQKNTKTEIADYVTQATRNCLVFCHKPVEGLHFVDIGKGLSEAILQEDLCLPEVSYAAEDALAKMLSCVETDASVGNYLALNNIGILFEPDLGFNVRNLFDRESIGKTLIICSPGTIRNNSFYFLSEKDGVAVDLSGIPFYICD